MERTAHVSPAYINEILQSHPPWPTRVSPDTALHQPTRAPSRSASSCCRQRASPVLALKIHSLKPTIAVGKDRFMRDKITKRSSAAVMCGLSDCVGESSAKSRNWAPLLLGFSSPEAGRAHKFQAAAPSGAHSSEQRLGSSHANTLMQSVRLSRP